MAVAEAADDDLRVPGDRGEQVVEVVGHATGQASHRLQLLGLPELFLEAFALGHVHHDPAQLAGLAVFVHRVDDPPEADLVAVRGGDPALELPGLLLPRRLRARRVGPRAVVGMHRLGPEPLLAGPALQRVPEHGFGLLADERGVQRACVGAPEDRVDGLHQPAVPAFALGHGPGQAVLLLEEPAQLAGPGRHLPPEGAVPHDRPRGDEDDEGQQPAEGRREVRPAGHRRPDTDVALDQPRQLPGLPEPRHAPRDPGALRGPAPPDRQHVRDGGDGHLHQVPDPQVRRGLAQGEPVAGGGRRLPPGEDANGLAHRAREAELAGAAPRAGGSALRGCGCARPPRPSRCRSRRPTAGRPGGPGGRPPPGAGSRSPPAGRIAGPSPRSTPWP